MSAPRSEQQKIIKRYGKAVERYEDRIQRQTAIIDRLVAANAVYGDALVEIENESKDIRGARKIASDTQAKVKIILAVPKEN